VGYDIKPTDMADLERLAKEHDADDLPAGLRFDQRASDRIDAATGAFDLVPRRSLQLPFHGPERRSAILGQHWSDG
jgi:hypothetical protein